MPAHRTSTQGRRLTTAGLIAVTAATLLMMAWAVFPTVAGATHGTPTPLGTPADPWDQNVGICHVTPGTIVANHPAINANNVPAINGHQGHVNDIVPPFYYDDDNDDSTPGVLSAGLNFSGANVALWNNECVQPSTTTPATTTTPGTTTTEATTTEATTTEATTTEVTTGSETTSTTPASSTSSATSTVQGTTVVPSDSTTPDQVSPTTVTPGGTAFTGIENVVPLGAIALMLATGGSAMLWAGSRRRRDDGDGEE